MSATFAGFEDSRVVSDFFGEDCSKMFCFCERGCAVFGGGMSLLSVALGIVERFAVHGRRNVGGSWPRVSWTALRRVRDIMLAIVVMFIAIATACSCYIPSLGESCGRGGSLPEARALVAFFGNPQASNFLSLQRSRPRATLFFSTPPTSRNLTRRRRRHAAERVH